MKNIHYISAGAGSGKTYTLTEILAEHIASGFCRPDEVLLTTFTEAAASEFREKTRRKLFQKGLADAAAEMSGARIGTIHSVAKSLIDRYWYRLGLAPAMTVLDDEGRARHIDESLASLASNDDLKAFRRLQSNFGFSMRNENFIPTPNHDFWKQHLGAIIEWMDNYTDLSLNESLDYCRRQFDSFFIINELQGSAPLEDQLGQVKSYFQAISNSGEASDSTLKKIAPLLHMNVEDESYQFAVKAMAATQLPKKLQNAPFAPGYVTVCEILEKSLRHVAHGRMLKDYVERIFRLATAWRRDYTDYKRLNRLIDYNDMERYFLRLLMDDAVAKEIHDSTRLVLVDEFQDCSPIEIRIFERLSDIVEELVWVGDVKQSIYGFRKSDVGMVEAFMQRFPEGEAHKDKDGCYRTSLSENYRSREKLVRAANAIFKPIFGPAAALEPHNGEFGVENLPPLELWQVEGDKCEAVANGVETMIQEDKILPGDIAILTRSNRQADAMAASLRNRGIPVTAVESDIADYIEVQLLVALINYAVLHDDFSKAAILAILTDCPVEKLIEERLDYLADTADKRWLEENELFRSIDSVIDRNRLQSISGFVESLIVELDFDNLINRWSGPDTARRRAHLDSVLAMAAAYEERAAQTGGASLGGFAHYLEQGKAPERPFEKDPHAISVLTYHKSKGLEWGHVVMTDLDFDSQRTLFAINLFEVQLHTTGDSTDGYPHRVISLFPNLFGLSAVPESLDPLLRELLHFDSANARICREEARLLYVGFTRARDRLIAVQPVKRGRDNESKPQTLKWLQQVGAATEIQIWHEWDGSVKIRHFEGNDNSQHGSETSKAEQYLRPEAPIRRPKSRYLQPSMIPSDPSSDDIDVRIVADRGSRIELHTKAETPMAELGTTLHNIFAVCNQGADGTVDRAQKILRRHDMEAVVPHPEQVVAVADWLYGWLEAEYGPARRVWHERPIRMWHDGQEVIGSIDLIWETERGCVVVDFKSFPGGRDTVTNPLSEHYAGSYAPQLRAYRDILDAAGVRVADTLICYAVQGCIVRL